MESNTAADANVMLDVTARPYADIVTDLVLLTDKHAVTGAEVSTDFVACIDDRV
jgi:hypothetical protein